METLQESDREKQLRRGITEEEKDHQELEKAHQPPPVQKLEVVYPESYRINSPEEIRLLEIAKNFQRQFSHLFPDRKPLLLCPVNECGVKKFVCTTLRPTLTVHPELFDWEGSSSFVANFLSLELLEPPVHLPRFLFSSTSVLHSQRATCFESATLLCSLLLGSGFNAYCVSGYADKDLCLLDQSHQDCPALDTNIKTVISEQEPMEEKYLVRPEWQYEFKSQFLERQEKQKEEAEAALLEKQKQQKETERRLADPLRGLRVHCWVLVLTGSNGVQENFFIDPLTGVRYDTAHHNFLGIESVWNHLNYYVNMQDCRNGSADMAYDLEDLNMWEPVLFGLSSKMQLIHQALIKEEREVMGRMIQDSEVEKKRGVLKLPKSWVSDITISEKDLETCWPGGQKVTHYKEAKLEKFAPYLRPDGLVTRLTTYRDPEYTEVAMVKEWYQHRNDHLEEREVNNVDNFTTERFKCGSCFHLLSHRFQSLSADSVHDMEFSFGRVDGLVLRVMSPGEMTETFKDREDFLYYRHVIFNPQIQFPERHQTRDGQVLKVVECFHRNTSKPANEDVAKRGFLPNERRIEVTHHLDDHRFIPSKMTFIKPAQSAENKKGENFTPDMLFSFQVCPSVKSYTKEMLYKVLINLMRDEEEVTFQIQMSKEEVRDIVASREQEENNIQLVLSPWSTEGAAKARSYSEEMERLAKEEQRFLQEREKDILALLLIQLDKSDTLSPEDAKQLHRNCLTVFKQKLVEHANLIQERCKKETDVLEWKQQWYQRNQLKITAAQEAEYQDFCSKKTLQIQVAKKRLHMHKKAAPQKYRDLDQKLRRDPRLANCLWSQ